VSAATGWDGARALVVGGAGFIGSNLTRALLDAGAARVTVVDNLLSAERSNVPNDPRVDYREGSIADDALLGGLDKAVDYVFHLATFHGNQNSIADPLADHANNLLTTLKLLEWARGAAAVKKIVYAASGCVLAPHTSGDPTPVKEDGPAPFHLDSPYQISKIVGEFYAVYYHAAHRLPTVRARFQNVYGPGEILGAGRWRGTPATVWRNVVPTFVYRALLGQALILEGDGSSSRDFIYVDDIVRGLMACASAGAPGDVYNLASGRETSIADLAERINRLAENPTPVARVPRRAWDHAGRRVGDTTKAERVLGFRAGVDIDEGLRRTVAWTRTNRPLIQACVDRHADRLAAAGAR